MKYIHCTVTYILLKTVDLFFNEVSWLSLQNSRHRKIQIDLMHHFGLSDAILFIKLGITEEKPARLLKVQVGVKPAAERYEPLGSYIKVHRKWLTDDINNDITLRNYFCPELTKPLKQEDVNLNDILEKFNAGVIYE